MIRRRMGYYKYIIKRCFTAFLYKIGVLSHKTFVNWMGVRKIVCSDENVKELYNCSNILYYIKTTEREGYFRPILPHKSCAKCVIEAVDNYFNRVHPEQELEKECLKTTLSRKKSFKKLLNVGVYTDPYSRARKFYLTKDTTIVGIESPRFLQVGSEEWNTFIWNIDHFIKYVMNAIERNKRNQMGGKWEFSNANRQMATEAIASLLGLAYMIPHSEFVVIEYKGEIMRGTLMDVAKGENTEGISLKRSHEVASPILQRELTSLSVLDAITYERDHRPGNYNIVINKEEKVSEISVFDNDSAMTFAPLNIQTYSGAGCSNIIDSNKCTLNRPHLDKYLAEKIFTLRKHELKHELKPYLNIIQINACWWRLKRVRNAIMESAKKNGFLLEKDQWTEETMKEELSGEYGRTYLKLFIDNESITRAFVDYNNAAPLN